MAEAIVPRHPGRRRGRGGGRTFRGSDYDYVEWTKQRARELRAWWKKVKGKPAPRLGPER